MIIGLLNMTEILKITNKKGLHHTDQINKLPNYIMPEISRKHKLSPHVDWDGRDLFIKLIANPNPIFAIFPKIFNYITFFIFCNRHINNSSYKLNTLFGFKKQFSTEQIAIGLLLKIAIRKRPSLIF